MLAAISVVSALLATAWAYPALVTEHNPVCAVLESSNRFTNSLYDIIAKQTDDNIFFSPLSIHTILSMAYQGANGTTAQSFASTLNIAEAMTAANGYREVLRQLVDIENVTILMANKVYLNQKNTLLENFRNVISKNFLSDVELIDFEQNREASNHINQWVQDKTNYKINNLVSSADLDALTKLILINAVYFKSSWKHHFSEKRTYELPFWLNDQSFVDVPMMNIREFFSHKFDNALDAQILELPYSNGAFSMVIILPIEKTGLAALERKLAYVDLNNITQDMLSVKVDVTLPKFTLEQSIDLKQPLTQLGLGEMFERGKANFRNIAGADEEIFVKKALHKAHIEVNEQGSEAAAATALIFEVRCGCLQIPLFRADHPFVFFIKAKSDRDIILFHGRVSKF